MFARIMTITYPVSIENIDGTTSSKALQSSLLTQFNTILYSISRVKDTNAKEQAAAHGALELCFTVIIQPITQNTALIIPNMIHIKFSSSRVDRHLTMPAPHRSVRAAFSHTALHNNIYSFRLSIPISFFSFWSRLAYSQTFMSFRFCRNFLLLVFYQLSLIHHPGFQVFVHQPEDVRVFDV